MSEPDETAPQQGPVTAVEPAPPPPLRPEQSEMPFAMVRGEAVTELPKDLYIPPQALEVFLDAFEGPLDLLLYLIRRQNLDILDIDKNPKPVCSFQNSKGESDCGSLPIATSN